MIYSFADCTLDTERYELRRGGEPCHVEPQVFDVLAYLLGHSDRIVTREELLHQVWGHSYVSEATLSSRLMAVRKAIGDSGKEQALIKTVRRRGYRFVGELGAVDTNAVPATAPMPAADADPLEAGELVGRDEELGQLHRQLRESHSGSRGFVLVTGEAGAGKTTLVDQFLAGLRPGTLVASGRCSEGRGAGEPYMPVLEALSRLASAPESDRVRMVLTRFAPAWVPQLPALFVDERLATPLPSDPRPERMLREMREALEQLSAELPTVLCVDDLHWADESTLALLDHVARSDGRSQLLIVATSRIEAGSPVDAMRRQLRPRGRCTELALSPLDEADIHTRLKRSYPGAEGLAAAIRRRTDGNPLFVECLLRSWIEVGLLVPEHGGWTAPKGEQSIADEVPETLRELLEQDLERLSPADRQVLEAASVCGLRCSAAAVAVAAELEVEEAEARCVELSHRGGFLRGLDPEIGPDGAVAGAFEFVHDLHRQVLYGRIPPAARAAMHHRLARRLERELGGASERAAEVAGHYLEANETESAVDFLQIAAERALQLGGQRDAVRELEKALELIERAPAEAVLAERELSLQAALAGALIAAEGWSSAGAERAFERGIELARARGEDRMLAALLYGLATLEEYRGDYSASEATVSEALAIDSAERDTVRMLEAHELMACSLFHQGSFGEAVEHADRGLRMREPSRLHPEQAFHGDDPAVSCHDWAGLSLWCQGRPREARERIAAALELASEPGRDYSLANALTHAARFHQLAEEAPEALRHATAAIRLAHERGFAYQEAIGSVLAGWARLAADSADDRALALIESGLEGHRETGATMDRPYYLALLAEGCAWRGEAERALLLIAEALDLVTSGRGFFYEAELHRLRGVFTLVVSGPDRGEAAAADFRRAIATAERQGAKPLQARAEASLASLMAERDEPEAAQR